jgi:hypothetical protein
MFKGRTDYGTTGLNGTRVVLSFTTKQYDGGIADQFKKYDKATLVFGNLFGNNTTVQVIRNGSEGTISEHPLRVSTDPVLSGFGMDEWGDQEIGMMTEGDLGSSINIRYINLKQKDLFWVKYVVTNNGIDDEMSLIGLYTYYSQSNRQLPFVTKLTALA